jgi:tetratricopeptide (TPR) repeat protein
MSSQFTLIRNGAVVVIVFASALISIGSRADSAASPLSDVACQQQVDGMVSHITDNLVEKADYYWHQGDYPRIIAVDRLVVQADPHDMTAFSDAGWLMESDGDDNDAEAFYQMGCTANPGHSFIAYQLGFFYFQTERQYGKAIGVLSKSVHDADAGDTDWKLLAHSYTRAGDLDQALATWKQIKKLYPTSPRVDGNMQEVEAMIQKQHAAGSTTQ